MTIIHINRHSPELAEGCYTIAYTLQDSLDKLMQSVQIVADQTDHDMVRHWARLVHTQLEHIHQNEGCSLYSECEDLRDSLRQADAPHRAANENGGR